MIAPGSGIDSIVEYDLASGFDLLKPEDLTRHILESTKHFIEVIEKFLSQNQSQ